MTSRRSFLTGAAALAAMPLIPAPVAAVGNPQRALMEKLMADMVIPSELWAINDASKMYFIKRAATGCATTFEVIAHDLDATYLDA